MQDISPQRHKVRTKKHKEARSQKSEKEMGTKNTEFPTEFFFVCFVSLNFSVVFFVALCAIFPPLRGDPLCG
jgi:hypothetical protein